VKEHIQKKATDLYKDRRVIIDRYARLTDPQAIHLEQGRAQYQARHLYYKVCLYGTYFSSSASIIPWGSGKWHEYPYVRF